MGQAGQQIATCKMWLSRSDGAYLRRDYVFVCVCVCSHAVSSRSFSLSLSLSCFDLPSHFCLSAIPALWTIEIGVCLELRSSIALKYMRNSHCEYYTLARCDKFEITFNAIILLCASFLFRFFFVAYALLHTRFCPIEYTPSLEKCSHCNRRNELCLLTFEEGKRDEFTGCCCLLLANYGLWQYATLSWKLRILSLSFLFWCLESVITIKHTPRAPAVCGGSKLVLRHCSKQMTNIWHTPVCVWCNQFWR